MATLGTPQFVELLAHRDVLPKSTGQSQEPVTTAAMPLPL
jgi:hypothetical protein